MGGRTKSKPKKDVLSSERGSDSAGRDFRSIQDMWRDAIGTAVTVPVDATSATPTASVACPTAPPAASAAAAAASAPMPSAADAGARPSEAVTATAPSAAPTADATTPVPAPPPSTVAPASFGSKPGWYSIGSQYWQHVEPTVDGMLGGFGSLSDVDVRESRQFLMHVRSMKGVKPFGFDYALDCGAGIGRVTEFLLLPMFQRVDTVEQDPTFVKTARSRFPTDRVPNTFCSGLQTFVPAPATYDLIWVQWVTGYLTDDDFVAFLRRCRTALLPDGLLCLKENISRDGFVLDRSDASITRTDRHLRHLFELAGLAVLHSALQVEFPQELFPVRMYALR